ncbi:MAG: helix-turn-helix domain-containing protein [Clostridiales bacterium]|nr:helix-turn-helix domain-containing protein [Clostridiales bacterium]
MSDTFEQDKLKDFTIVRNSIFRDYRLSAKAKGVACQLLSLPPTWEYSVKGIVTLFSDGEASIRSALSELESLGYLRREQDRSEGKFGKIKYIITDVLKREKPYVENPQAVNSVADNQAQLNTKESITELLNTKESLQTEFEKLWELYPRKQGKADAFKHYLKARKSNVTYEDIEQGIFAYKNYIKTNNIDMQYVKMGSTFFSQKSWGDDWTIRNKSKGNSRRELFARLYEEHKDDL